MLSNYFHAEARVAVANGLKFVAINNIPLEKNRRSSFNVLSKRPEQQPHLDAEFSFNMVAGSRCGKTTAHQFVFANATPERPALHFTILGASLRYQRDGVSGAQLPAPFGAASALSPLASRPGSREPFRARRSVVALRTPVLCALHGGGHEKGRRASAGKNYLAEIRRRLEHREPGRVASLILFSLSL